MEPNEVVNQPAEAPQQAPSTSVEQMPGNTEDTSAAQSGEDYNTPAGENETEGTEELKEKSQNRFQDLANKNSQLEAELAQYRSRPQTALDTYAAMEQDVVKQASQFPAGSQQHIEATLLSLQIADEGRRLEADYNNAVKILPEMADDADLDNLVYSIFLAQRQMDSRVKLADVAKQMGGYLQKREATLSSKAYSDAEDKLTNKASTSSKPIGSSLSKGDNNEKEMARVLQQVRETGNNKLLDEYLNY